MKAIEFFYNMYLKVNRWVSGHLSSRAHPAPPQLIEVHRITRWLFWECATDHACFCYKPYLQPNVTELPVFPQGVHFGHGRVQETFILKDQITVLNHLGKIFDKLSKEKKKREQKNAFSPALMNIFCSARHAFRCRIVNAGLFHWRLHRIRIRRLQRALSIIILALVVVLPNRE